jgi:hypothetical protein
MIGILTASLIVIIYLFVYNLLLVNEIIRLNRKIKQKDRIIKIIDLSGTFHIKEGCKSKTDTFDRLFPNGIGLISFELGTRHKIKEEITTLINK